MISSCFAFASNVLNFEVPPPKFFTPSSLQKLVQSAKQQSTTDSLENSATLVGQDLIVEDNETLSDVVSDKILKVAGHNACLLFTNKESPEAAVATSLVLWVPSDFTLKSFKTVIFAPPGKIKIVKKISTVVDLVLQKLGNASAITIQTVASNESETGKALLKPEQDVVETKRVSYSSMFRFAQENDSELTFSIIGSPKAAVVSSSATGDNSNKSGDKDVDELYKTLMNTGSSRYEDNNIFDDVVTDQEEVIDNGKIKIDEDLLQGDKFSDFLKDGTKQESEETVDEVANLEPIVNNVAIDTAAIIAVEDNKVVEPKSEIVLLEDELLQDKYLEEPASFINDIVQAPCNEESTNKEGVSLATGSDLKSLQDNDVLNQMGQQEEVEEPTSHEEANYQEELRENTEGEHNIIPSHESLLDMNVQKPTQDLLLNENNIDNPNSTNIDESINDTLSSIRGYLSARGEEIINDILSREASDEDNDDIDDGSDEIHKNIDDESKDNDAIIVSEKEKTLAFLDDIDSLLLKTKPPTVDEGVVATTEEEAVVPELNIDEISTANEQGDDINDIVISKLPVKEEPVVESTIAIESASNENNDSVIASEKEEVITNEKVPVVERKNGTEALQTSDELVEEKPDVRVIESGEALIDDSSSDEEDIDFDFSEVTNPAGDFKVHEIKSNDTEVAAAATILDDEVTEYRLNSHSDSFLGSSSSIFSFNSVAPQLSILRTKRANTGTNASVNRLFNQIKSMSSKQEDQRDEGTQESLSEDNQNTEVPKAKVVIDEESQEKEILPNTEDLVSHIQALLEGTRNKVETLESNLQKEGEVQDNNSTNETETQGNNNVNEEARTEDSNNITKVKVLESSTDDTEDADVITLNITEVVPEVNAFDERNLDVLEEDEDGIIDIESDDESYDDALELTSVSNTVEDQTLVLQQYPNDFFEIESQWKVPDPKVFRLQLELSRLRNDYLKEHEQKQRDLATSTAAVRHKLFFRIMASLNQRIPVTKPLDSSELAFNDNVINPPATPQKIRVKSGRTVY